MRSVVRAHLSPPKAAPRSFEMCGTDADYLRWHVGFAGQSQNKAATATFLFTYFTFRFTRSLFTSHPLLLFQTLSFTFPLFTITYNLFWGISAVGSAQHWQCWGQGFKSPMLHHRKHFERSAFLLYLRILYRKRWKNRQRVEKIDKKWGKNIDKIRKKI